MVNTPTIIAALDAAFKKADAEECGNAAIKGAMTAQQLSASTGMSIDQVMRALGQAEKDVMKYHIPWETGPAGQAKAAKEAHNHVVYGLKKHRDGQQGWVPTVQE